MSKRLSILVFLLAILIAAPFKGYAEGSGSHAEEEDLDVKEIIFEHLGDGYGWEVKSECQAPDPPSSRGSYQPPGGLFAPTNVHHGEQPLFPLLP